MYIEGSQVIQGVPEKMKHIFNSLLFQTRIAFLSLKIILVSAKNIDPDEMHYVAFHLGLHCLSKYPLRGFQYTLG